MTLPSKTRGATRTPEWVRYTTPRLLDLRFRDLGLRVEDTVLPRRLDRIHRELEHHGIKFRPHIWLSDDWFSPDGIPGFAIPFYLAHPRLMKLEDEQMLEVEGGSESWCLKLMRHETGHAIDSAFRLHRRALWRKTFGSFAKPYPKHYRPRPLSRRFVRHLDSWYAQSHPAEDFAETFAVWLRPGAGWRRRYEGWPALKKLEATEAMMRSIRGKTPPVLNRLTDAPVSRLDTTLREYYEAKRAHYVSGYQSLPDPDLLRLFAPGGSRRKAAAFLKRVRPELRRVVSRGTGEHPYTIDQVLNDMIARCRELGLVVDRPDDTVRLEAAVLLSVRTMGYLQKSGRQWIPL